ncbi:MAG TPA: hypothetical protein VGU43_04165 [Thermoplasmata archaeon]|nr:hypothetical protein [Thermoplasmata archaeon]
MTPEGATSGDSAEAPERCGIPECTEPAARSLARVELRKAFPDLEEGSGRLAICRVHYKTYKKSTKGDRSLERIGRYK